MWLHAVLILSFFVGSQCTEGGINCFAKEKSTKVLDLANDTLEKLKHLFSNCTNDHLSSNASECGVKEKALSLLERATDSISEVKRNYLKCLDDPVTGTDTITETEPVTVTESVTDPVVPKGNPIDCDDVLQQGKKFSGVYRIFPKHGSLNGNSILVYCEMDILDGRGWTVIQRRGVKYPRKYFNQNWVTYKKGFSDLNGEFWLGNQNIYALTNQADYMLQVDLEDVKGIKKYASYRKFWIDGEEHKYKLHVREYTGNAGNSMAHESEMAFATKDRSQNEKVNGVLCVESRATGWWYWPNKYCNGANLNGVPSTRFSDDPKNLYWKEWKQYASLARASMKIRRR